jgi:hypothetical protein
MKKFVIILIASLLSALFTDTYAQNKDEYVPPGGARLMVQVTGNDTVLLAYLHDIWVFPRKTFKNKAQEEFFWRTVRDVKKTLPYARLVASELTQINYKLATMPNDKVRKKYLSQVEKEVFKKYEPDLRKMSINQGKLLLKLIDRECDKTSYELIKIYRGNVSAFFWQGVALVFGSNLKSGYDASEKDRVIERVILLVEAGQL